MKTFNINESLGKLDIYKAAACYRCNYWGKPGELNIEQRIEHNKPIVCLDNKECRRRQRKLRRR